MIQIDWYDMLAKTFHKSLLFLTVIMAFTLIGCRATDPLAPQLTHIGQRLNEEIETNPSEPNSVTFKRATGQLPSRKVSPRRMEAERVLSLDECLQMAFENNNQIKETRQQLSIAKGNEIIINSRFLPNVELIYQYEHLRNFNSGNPVDISSLICGLSQSIGTEPTLIFSVGSILLSKCRESSL